MHGSARPIPTSFLFILIIALTVTVVVTATNRQETRIVGQLGVTSCRDGSTVASAVGVGKGDTEADATAAAKQDCAQNLKDVTAEAECTLFCRHQDTQNVVCLLKEATVEGPISYDDPTCLKSTGPKWVCAVACSATAKCDCEPLDLSDVGST